MANYTHIAPLRHQEDEIGLVGDLIGYCMYYLIYKTQPIASFTHKHRNTIIDPAAASVHIVGIEIETRQAAGPARLSIQNSSS